MQIDGNGKLVYWGQDVGGGSNISLIVSPSDEDTSALQITMDPADAAGEGRNNAAGCIGRAARPQQAQAGAQLYGYAYVCMLLGAVLFASAFRWLGTGTFAERHAAHMHAC